MENKKLGLVGVLNRKLEQAKSSRKKIELRYNQAQEEIAILKKQNQYLKKRLFELDCFLKKNEKNT